MTTADLFAADAAPRAAEACLAACKPDACAVASPGRFDRLVRLPDGSRVSSWSEAWREACEVAHLLTIDDIESEIKLIAAKRSGKDPDAEAAILARLRRLLHAETSRRAGLFDELCSEARAILALPDKPARRARLAEIEAADGILRRADFERVILDLWSR